MAGGGGGTLKAALVTFFQVGMFGVGVSGQGVLLSSALRVPQILGGLSTEFCKAKSGSKGAICSEFP